MSSVRYCLGRDFQPAAAAAAYFGELEEALIHGAANAGGVGHHPGSMITSDMHSAKCKPSSSSDLFSASPPKKGQFLSVLLAGQRHRGWKGRDMPRLLRS